MDKHWIIAPTPQEPGSDAAPKVKQDKPRGKRHKKSHGGASHIPVLQQAVFPGLDSEGGRSEVFTGGNIKKDRLEVRPSPKKENPEDFKRIGDVASMFEVKTCVLRFWEDEFSVLQPKRTQSGQRLYSGEDIALLRKIKTLLYEKGMTIDGARRILGGEKAPRVSKVAASASRAEFAVPAELNVQAPAPCASENINLASHEAESASALASLASLDKDLLNDVLSELVTLKNLLQNPGDNA